jgi:hypothetical protein
MQARYSPYDLSAFVAVSVAWAGVGDHLCHCVVRFVVRRLVQVQHGRQARKTVRSCQYELFAEGVQAFLGATLGGGPPSWHARRVQKFEKLDASTRWSYEGWHALA